MILAVLLKQVEFIYARSGKDPERHFVGRFDRVHLNNPLDEVALEQAVRIKETLGEGRVFILSFGERLLEKEAVRALAMGADHFVHLGGASWGELDAWATAVILSAAVRKVSADLVLCGAASLDQGRGEVGMYVAGWLSAPYVPQVVGLTVLQGGRTLLIERALGKGEREELEADPPLVLAAAKGLCAPRYPCLAERVRARDKEIWHWGLEDLDLEPGDLEGRVRLGPLLSPRPRTKWIPLLDGRLPAPDRIEWLLAGSGGEKGGAVIEGRPRELAIKLLDFLREKKLAPGKGSEEQADGGRAL
ncbi:MAG: electron transfer flavoprotein subunit beta/FixA family protein [Thermodesulfobacteriota bacterium]